MSEPAVTVQFTGFSEEELKNMGPIFTGTPVRVDAPALVAAAPPSPPRAAFEREEPSTPTPMTYGDDGSVYGHLALWGSCHRGFIGGAYEQCVQPPQSRSDYSQFHLGYVKTQEGEDVAIGKITFDTDHAPLTADYRAASAHYDNTGSVGAYVRARNGKLGIWLSGVTVSDLAPAKLQSLRANPLSGDWRSFNRSLDLVASLAVPVQGFAVERVQLSLAASANGEPEVETLILPGYCGCEEDVPVTYTPQQILSRRITAGIFSTE